MPDEVGCGIQNVERDANAAAATIIYQSDEVQAFDFFWLIADVEEGSEITKLAAEIDSFNLVEADRNTE